jgi:hypothetical protein
LQFLICSWQLCYLLCYFCIESEVECIAHRTKAVGVHDDAGRQTAKQRQADKGTQGRRKEEGQTARLRTGKIR